MNRKKLIGMLAVAFVAAPACAGQWDGDPDLQESILNETDEPPYFGTGLPERGPQVNFYGSLMSEPDTNGFAAGRADPEEGHNDEYGSILVEIGVRPK
jgi:hypothetical protein